MKVNWNAIPIWCSLVAALAPFYAVAGSGNPTWDSGNHVVLNWSDDPRSGLSATWDLTLVGPGDFRVRATQRRRGREISSIYSVRGGSLLILEKFDREGGSEWDQLQFGTVMLNVLYALLEKALPDGPSGVRALVPMDVVVSDQPLRISRNDSVAFYGAPWSLAGTVKPARPDGVIFDFTFTYTLAEGRSSATGKAVQRFVGVWRHAADVSLPADFRLTGMSAISLVCLNQPVAEGITLQEALRQSTSCK